MISRRRLLQGCFGAGVAASSVRNVLASDSDERQFLFVFCEGGWDQCHMFAPLWDVNGIDMEFNSYLTQIGNIPFVDSEQKPSVSEFLQSYGANTCMINGIGVRSVAHDTCLRLISAGTSDDRCNDWASIIASHSQSGSLMPHVVLSGPNYASDLSQYVGRVGENGQLGWLLPAENFTSPSIDELEDQWLQALHHDREMGNLLAQSLKERAMIEEGNLQSIQALDSTLNLLRGDTEINTDLRIDMDRAIDLLSSGVSRCVSVKHKGWMGLGYDSHAANSVQAKNFEELFEELKLTMDTIQTAHSALYNRLTVVVISEMGRFPRLNGRQGKTHWMHTSAMVMGSGVQGDRVIGEYDDRCASSPIDLSSGGLSSGGTLLVPEHLGATLLSLADIDPSPYLPGYSSIGAVLQ